MGVPSTSARTASINARPDGAAGCARWLQRADGRASSPGPRGLVAACWGRSCRWVTVVGAELLATGHGKAVRTAAGPARADLGWTGCAAPHSGRGPRVRPKEHLLLADLGPAGTAGHAERTVGQAVRRHILPRKKRLGRRRFAPAQPGSEYSRFDGRRDGNAADTRPRAGEVFTGGRTVAPCPVQTGQWVIGHTQQLPGWRGVLGVALG